MMVAIIAACVACTDSEAADLENTLYMDLKDGRVVIEMRPDLAPKHVAQIKQVRQAAGRRFPGTARRIVSFHVSGHRIGPGLVLVTAA